MTHLKIFLSVLGLIILGALAFLFLNPVGFLNGITPSFSYKVSKDIAYGPHERHKLDIYRAKKPDAAKPLLVFVHGGGWRNGDKSMYKFLAQGFTKDGFDVAVPNYRLAPEAVYPDMLEDTALAVAKVSDTYPNRPLVLMGHSAGAYNVLMMGLSPNYLAADDVPLCQRVAGIISLAGPTGAIKLESPKYVAVFPNRFNGKDGAINNVTGPAPPIMLAQGLEDDQVHPKNATELTAKIEARSGRITQELYEGASHNDMVKFLSRYFDGGSTVKADIMSFIDGLPKNGNFCQ